MKAMLTVTFAAALLATSAAAQERPGPAVEVAAGALFFADDGVVTEPFGGAAARFYVTPRISIGPEIAFISGEGHSHFMLTGNLTFDFLAPSQGQPRAVTPFVVVGGGMFRTNERFFDDAFTSTDGAFTAGGGIRARAGRRVIAGAEARVGWELHIRLHGFLGVQLGG
jgi:hypothetical protein